MGRRKRFKVRQSQKAKRKRRLDNLKKKSQNIGEYFSNGYYIGPRGTK